MNESFQTNSITRSAENLFDRAPVTKWRPVDLPVIGYPGPEFAGIHLTALCVLSLSVVASIGVLLYLCVYEGHAKTSEPSRSPRHEAHQARGPPHPSGNNLAEPIGTVSTNVSAEASTSSSASSLSVLPVVGGSSSRVLDDVRKQANARESFWKWTIGERLVVYLACCDLCMSVSHMLDHIYIYSSKSQPPDVACTVLAFFLQEFIFAQWIVVLFTAVSACLLVVFNRKLNLGRCDYRLLVVALGGPLVLGIVGANVHFIGQSGAWWDNLYKKT